MPELDAVLAGLLASTGAQAARVVDGRRGTVLAEVGVAGGDDLATVVSLARDAAPRDQQDAADLVVATAQSVHVLREAEVPGTFLHVRLDRERGDVPAARRCLASPDLHRAVRAALGRLPGPSHDAGPSSAATGAGPAGARPSTGALPSGRPPTGSHRAPAGAPPAPGATPPGAPYGRPPDPPADGAAAPSLADTSSTDAGRTRPPSSGPPGDAAGAPAAGEPGGRPPTAAQQPALVTLDTSLPRLRSGAMAVLALPPVPPPTSVPSVPDRPVPDPPEPDPPAAAGEEPAVAGRVTDPPVAPAAPAPLPQDVAGPSAPGSPGEPAGPGDPDPTVALPVVEAPPAGRAAAGRAAAAPATRRAGEASPVAELLFAPGDRGGDTPASPDPAPRDPLPRRRPAPPPLGPEEASVPVVRPAVLNQTWARDVATMRRLVEGLRALR